MIIAYDSMTGNVERFVNKLNMKNIRITEDLILDESFVLVTYTIGFGEVPHTTSVFLENNHKNMLAVASSGNKNWGSNYSRSGILISQKYSIPLILRFELSGTKKDVEIFKQEVAIFEQ